MRFLFPALAFGSLLTFASASQEADVIVYGSTPGGFCAAIGAAREGVSVILLEPTSHVGGVNTGGLSFSDSNQTVRSTVMGLFDEWHRRISEDYRKRGVELAYDVTVKDNSKWTYEPGVAARVTNAMLEEAGVTVIANCWLESVEMEAQRIVALRAGGERYVGRIFVDATYEGDLMAAAGVDWTIGRESRSEFGESLAGKQYPKATMNFSGFDEAGNPLPLITATEAGPEEEGDSNVMVYSFRLCLTKTPENRVPFPEPAAYDPGRFEAIRRYLAVEKRPILLWDIYPLPNGKFDANNGIGKQFSMGLVGACNGWSEASREERLAIWEQHKQYTLELYRFLTTDSAVPEHLRKELAEYGLCRDEFAEYGHWSPQLYVREGRRMKGMYVLSQKDILEQPQKDDCIAVSSFPIDSHDCRRVAVGDTVMNEGTIFPVRMPDRPCGYPYQVPYRSILPRAEECGNLVVPVALSCTHVAISSLRVEPTWMILGQSAGIAAALAADEGVSVQDVVYEKLRDRLLSQGQVLDLPGEEDLPPKKVSQKGVSASSFEGVVLDDSDAELKGAWDRSTNFDRYVGAAYFHDGDRGDGNSTATFRFLPPRAGNYEVRMAYSPHETRSRSVPLTIESGGETHRILVDQTEPISAGDVFRVVGNVALSGTETVVTVSNEKTEGFVILDAIQFVPLE